LTASILNYELSAYGSLAFYGDKLNDKSDFFISANCEPVSADLLVFFDSRGISANFRGSIVEKVINKVSPSEKYLMVSRPLEITTWMTLFNFVKLNNLCPKKILTNMGFVDFTPKKILVIEKSTIQYNCFFNEAISKVNFVEKYPATDGSEIDLYMQAYPDVFSDELASFFAGTEFLILNTPILREGYTFERPRPLSFFYGVKQGNVFNEKLELTSHIFNFDQFSAKETYDGVHYTASGNDLIFNTIEPYL
jgi:hypothetical protein